MLTIEQRNANKKRYYELLQLLNVDMTGFTNYLNIDRVQFFEKPYSQYPDSMYEGSLCEHSLKVYDELVKLNGLYCNNKYSTAQLIQVALLKDIYRAELYEFYPKNVKNDATGLWETQIACKVKDNKPTFGDASFSSYMIARKFFDLKDDAVVEAICYSGICTSNIDLNNIRKDYSLVVLTTIAELAILYLGV